MVGGAGMSTTRPYTPWWQTFIEKTCQLDDACELCGGTGCVRCGDLPPAVDGWEPCPECCACMQAWRDVRDAVRGDDSP